MATVKDCIYKRVRGDGYDSVVASTTIYRAYAINMLGGNASASSDFLGFALQDDVNGATIEIQTKGIAIGYIDTSQTIVKGDKLKVDGGVLQKASATEMYVCKAEEAVTTTASDDAYIPVLIERGVA